MAANPKVIEDEDISGSAYSNVNASRSAYTNVRLANSTYRDVNMASSAFEDVDLSHARLRNACLAGVTIADSNLEGATIDGILVTDLLRTYREKSGYGASRAARVSVEGGEGLHPRRRIRNTGSARRRRKQVSIERNQ